MSSLSHQLSRSKYVFKYQHKGPDRVLVELVAVDNNEIEQFVLGRFLSAAEAVWKLLGFNITERPMGSSNCLATWRTSREYTSRRERRRQPWHKNLSTPS